MNLPSGLYEPDKAEEHAGIPCGLTKAAIRDPIICPKGLSANVVRTLGNSIRGSVLQPPGNKKVQTFQKGLRRKPKNIKVLPLVSIGMCRADDSYC